MTPRRTIARAIRRHRESRGLSLAALASLLGVHMQSVHRWESGTRSPSAEDLARLAVALDVEFGALLPDRATLRESMAKLAQ